MRVLSAMTERQEFIGLTGMVRRYAFPMFLGVALASYMVLLIKHPGADAVSLYPEPVDSVLYDASFPSHRGAEPWTKTVHHLDIPTKCEDRSAQVYREVGAERCGNLIRRIGDAATSTVPDSVRCRYFYKSVSAAQLGTQITFVLSGETCFLP